MKERIIIGIDPGTNIMGYGIIRITNYELGIRNNTSVKNKSSKIELIKLDVLKLSKLDDHALKLKKIFDTTLGLIDEFKPDELALEAPFFGKNIQSMLKLGRAQGVSMAAALYREVPIFEYSPRKIKQSITGKGSSSKEQVSSILMNLLNIKEAPKYLDATDGLAVAVCHYFQKTILISSKSTVHSPQTTVHSPQSTDHSSPSKKQYNGWKAFLTENPKRIKK